VLDQDLRRGAAPRPPAASARRGRRLVAAFAVAFVGLATAGCSSGASNAGNDTGSTTTEAERPNMDADLTLTTDGDVVATVDDRYQSYNIEMVEVTGGEFWKPYDAGPGKVVRPPIDLADKRIRNLAKALGPSYIRVSGTWANATYFDPTGSAGEAPPDGFGGVLTGAQWKGVGAFAYAIGAKIVVSLAATNGVRDASGVWQLEQAKALLEVSVANHIPLAAAEFINEPSLPINVPAGYDAADYQRDFQAFVALAHEVMPDLKIVGPGATADLKALVIDPTITVDELMKASGSALDVFSYHFYPNVSKRCGSTEPSTAVLTDEFLGRVGKARDFYAKVRDRYVPGAPMWITETAQAACGGDPWSAWFQDSIRYVDTLGRLARGDGDVVFHNTLAASDYALIDENGLVPRADYWAGVLWARLVGPKVLTVHAGADLPDLTTYAHCTAADAGGTAYVVVNASTTVTRTVAVGNGSVTTYQLTAKSLDARSTMLNGTVLKASADGTLPAMVGKKADGPVTIPPASVTYVVDQAPNRACA
jgi:hypothetical protein